MIDIYKKNMNRRTWKARHRKVPGAFSYGAHSNDSVSHNSKFIPASPVLGKKKREAIRTPSV